MAISISNMHSNASEHGQKLNKKSGLKNIDDETNKIEIEGERVMMK